ncbi:MAG: hypothetical protein PARBA_03443 [Parabacteroides sp.]
MRDNRKVLYDVVYEKMFAALTGYQLFSDDLCELLYQNSTAFSFSKGDFLLTEDKDCSMLYFIVEGFCSSFYHKDGKECIVRFSEENQFCTSWYSFLGGHKSFINIKAIKETRTIGITRDSFNNLLNNSLEFISIINRVLENHVVENEIRSHIMRSNSAEERVRHYMDTHEIYHLMKYVPQYCIASYLDMTPEVFSKILKEIKGHK